LSIDPVWIKCSLFIGYNSVINKLFN
jgi:hypothetical protein